MGLVESIQSLNQLAWPGGEAGQGRGALKSAAPRPQTFSPAGVETPEEALAYIQQLHQDGRTAELAGLLRHNPVFREAWQTLQQSASLGSGATGGPASPLSDPAPATEPANLPVPAPGQAAAGQLLSAGQDLAAAQITANRGYSPEIPQAQNNLVPTPKPSALLAAGLQVYGNQAFYFAQDQANSSRINIIV